MTEVNGAMLAGQHRLPSTEVRGLRVMVTGASRGLGRAIAQSFARGGAEVACVSRTEGLISELAGSLGDEGHRAVALPADLADPAAAASLPARAAGQLGGLDVVINNAGIPHPGGHSYEAWATVVATNLTAPYLISEAAVEIFKAQGRGRIINVGSILGLVMDHGCAPAYVASKHGLIGLTKSFAVLYGQHNIQVNCVAPGYFPTTMTEPEFRDEGLRQSIIDRTPAGRWAQLDDITGVVAFLASDSARHITGQTIVVDGGWTSL